MRRLRQDDGVALAVALGALSVLLVISAITFGSSMRLSRSSETDRSDKRAFAAANAGLQVATYRLNNLSPPDDQCVGAGQVPEPGPCTASGELSDGARWTYTMTPVMTGGTCAGFPVSYNSTTGTLAPRCVTATGHVNGLSKRVQARLVLFKGNPLYPLQGIVGLQGVSVRNSAKVDGSIGSNGQVTVGNSSEISGTLELAPGAPSPVVGNSQASVTYRSPEQGAWVLSPVEIGNTATVNDNGAWTLQGNPSLSWNPTTRELNVTRGTLTLQGGTYNFCKLTIGSNATIAVAAGARARIFIDSPERGAASGCAAGTGTVEASNNFTNPGRAQDLQLYVYGADPSSSRPAVTFNNAATLNMAIHAPRATVLFKNAATISGAVNAARVDFKNTLDFSWDPELAGVRSLSNVVMYERTAWRECRRSEADAGSTAC